MLFYINIDWLQQFVCARKAKFFVEKNAKKIGTVKMAKIL